MFYTVRYPTNDVPYTVYNWLEDNCQGAFYTGFDWEGEWGHKSKRIVQFENQADATAFALKWA